VYLQPKVAEQAAKPGLIQSADLAIPNGRSVAMFSQFDRPRHVGST
jgi:hypothetical protein